MATTAPENVIIVKIVKHVISTQGHVMRMGVCCRVINHSCVMVSKERMESTIMYSSLLILCKFISGLIYPVKLSVTFKKAC